MRALSFRAILLPGAVLPAESAYRGLIGPHPVGKEELSAAFNAGNGWNVDAIEPDRIQTRFHDEVPAWLATIKRV